MREFKKIQYLIAVFSLQNPRQACYYLAAAIVANT